MTMVLTSLGLAQSSQAAQAQRKKRANASTASPKTASANKRVKASKALPVTPSEKSKVVKVVTPKVFVDERVTRILRDLKGRAPRARSNEPVVAKLPVWTTKSQWLQAIYSKQLVDISNSTGLLSDKLLFYEVAKRELGPAVDKYLVQTVGLRDFLVGEGLIAADGRILADGDKIESSLFKKFQSGFVARPAVGVAPRETGRGLFRDSDEFVAELLKADSILYRPEHGKRPVRSTVLDEIASGEAIVLQDDLIAKTASNLKAGAAKPGWREVRVHTYEGRVVTDAVANFWVRDGKVSKAEAATAQKFVSDFLALLPPSLLSRQAWSFDVLILGPGDLKIVDLVTNRGRRTAWSGYLDQPRVIGAYTRHFEKFASLHFGGMSGLMLRKNAGNYFAYWGLRIEKSRPGLEKILAWIPPWP